MASETLCVSSQAHGSGGLLGSVPDPCHSCSLVSLVAYGNLSGDQWDSVQAIFSWWGYPWHPWSTAEGVENFPQSPQN